MSKNKPKNKLLKGIVWSFIEIVIKRAFDFFVKLVLAKLLFPEDFGIVGMAVVFTSFVQVLNDAGMSMAIIQKKEDDMTPDFLNTAYWTGLVWSLFLFLLMLFVVGPFAAYFYAESLLVKVVPVLSITLLTSALNMVHRTQLMRELEFKKISFINNTSNIVSGLIAILLAYCGWGIWSLVFYSVFASIMMIPLYFRATRWKPDFRWNRTDFKSILSFGLYTSGSQLITNISSHVDYLIIGKMISATALGLYTFSFTLTSLVKSQIYSMLNRVLYPFYSSIQSDRDKIVKYYLLFLRVFSIVIYFFMLFLILYGEYFITAMFGDKWAESILPMKILAVSVIVNSLTSGYNLIIRSTGNPKLEMNIQLCTTGLFFIPGIIVGTMFWGIVGTAMGILIAQILSFIVIQVILKKQFQISVVDIIKTISPAFFASLTSSVICYLLSLLLHSIIVNVVLFIILYVCITFPFLKRELAKKNKKGNE